MRNKDKIEQQDAKGMLERERKKTTQLSSATTTAPKAAVHSPTVG
jgi:hypothetical protein